MYLQHGESEMHQERHPDELHQPEQDDHSRGAVAYLALLAVSLACWAAVGYALWFLLLR